MRYTGGLYGGSWMTALAGDLGARHVRRRLRWSRTSRIMNPANTLWTKQYNL